MNEAPTGTVTLVFTDIEGSTLLWEHFGDAFKPVLDLHNVLFREAIGEYGGYEVKTEGDAFMVAFASPEPAVQMCLALQTRLHQTEWPVSLEDSAVAGVCGPTEDGAYRGIRVRMGIHTGEVDSEPDPVTGRMDYFGRVVNRASRVSSVGHGGQVLLSQATREALKNGLSGMQNLDLGEHALRGLERREVLTQVLPPGLSSRTFPRLRSVDLRKTNLPSRLDTFFGRERELVGLSDRFEQEQRLVSLVGAGGTGKTRLSQRFGAQQLDRFPGGVWFCDLSTETDEAGVLGAVARAMEFSLAGASPAKAVSDALRNRGRMLIILDNFEQVVETGAPMLAQWLQEAPEALFLVTSRRRLGIQGEHIFYLDPLLTHEAVHLFVDRAAIVQPDFVLTESNREVITEIVERLDCMSLAIELAASRVRLVPVEGILQRLSQRFKLLRGMRRDQAARQDTLRGAIDWSWELLEPWEQLALAQCSVFRRGFTIEAAEEVVNLESYPESPWNLDVIQSLVDHSLLRVVEPREGHQRLRMFDSIQEYASEKMKAENPIGTGTDALKDIRLRHLRYFGGFYNPYLQEPPEGSEHSKRYWGLLFELENLVAGAETGLELGDVESAIHCALAAALYFKENAPPEAGLRLLGRLLDASTDYPRLQAHLLLKSGQLLRALGDASEAMAQVEAGLSLASSVGDRPVKAQMHAFRGFLERERGHREAALADLEQAIAIAKEVDDHTLVAKTLNTLGGVHAEAGRLLEARTHFKRCRAEAQRLGLTRLEVNALLNLGNVLDTLGDTDQAISCIEAAGDLKKDLSSRRVEGMIHGTLAMLYSFAKRFEEAGLNYMLAVGCAREVGDRSYHAVLQGNWGTMLKQHGDPEAAQQKLEYAIEVCDDIWPSGAGAFRGTLAQIFAQRGDLETAHTLLKQGEEQLVGVNLPALGSHYLHWAEVEHIAGNPTERDQALMQARDVEAKLSKEGASELSRSIEEFESSIVL
ncbi:MAG: adenylate/guanylate cyclase domain-containing protein [Myxococcota bacterium]|nr:adenylate/guanylate cyclase domain-containing protein [Myxococcota bacterium]